MKYLTLEFQGDVAVVGLNRPEKRNAISDAFIEELNDVITQVEARCKAAVIHGHGPHFCAGLDLAEHVKKTPFEGVHGSRRWHEVFARIQRGKLPWFGALHGAVVGGGLELASSVHIRVMDETTYFGLPEGQRGLFTGGGATIRVPRLIGQARMMDMMLTGRLYSGDEAVQVGLAQYRVADSEAQAYDLARRVAQNTPLSNFAVCSAISHMQNMSGLDAAYAEAMVAGIVNTQDAARGRLDSFAQGTAQKIKPGEAG